MRTKQHLKSTFTSFQVHPGLLSAIIGLMITTPSMSTPHVPGMTLATTSNIPPYYIRGKGPRISADIRGICPEYSSHGYLLISRAYATDICRYPLGGTQALTLTEKN